MESPLFPPERPRRHGLTDRQETAFHILASLVIFVMMAAWIVALARVYERPQTESSPTPSVTRAVTSALLDPRARSTAFISDAALRWTTPLRGYSGAVNIAVVEPGEAVTDEPLEPGMEAQFETSEGSPAARARELRAPEQPGIYKVALQLDKARRVVDDLFVVSLVPFERKREGRIGRYLLGTWPYERGGSPRSARYANPRGFIEVTPDNRNTPVSEHFVLGDFLTKGQDDVWPKYVVVDPKLLDKMELTIQELKRQGHVVTNVDVMSGFRNPHYNARGGNTAGRASTSRHQYGDAADFYVDNDGNGWLDDLNGDGRTDEADARIMANAAESVEQNYPALIGGIGIYRTCCGHGPFIHVDVRGYRARW